MNLSSQDLSLETKRVFERGLIFAPTPKSIPKVNIVGSVEAALLKQKKLLSEETECGRAAIAGLIVKEQPPRQNVSKKEREAIRSLKENEDIVIIEADKGNSTVV